MKPSAHFETVLPDQNKAIVWAVYYGPRNDRRVRFALNKTEAKKIAQDALKGPHVDADLPATWPDAFYFDRAKLRPWLSDRRMIVNGPETIYERP